MNKKQKMFANFYIETLNATESAQKAGYSEKTAYSIGQRLLKNVEIKQYIDEQLERIQNERIASAQEVLELLTKMARGETEEEVIGFDIEGNPNKVNKKVNCREQVKAQELLGKRYKLFTDKMDMTTNKPVIIVDDISNLPIEDDEDEAI